ncbi:hypothetical protein FTUN_4416 [Frigoriglobus tundricola]|uniref:Uncharacterized protein n=1 Tax=Frigoriglobus tundricola TaxID=2774151 RepID=A0A6M5YTV3_9BACT|nr:hypothetical protein FTUN_4416 [Frigoriglobus tundricola]
MVCCGGGRIFLQYRLCDRASPVIPQGERDEKRSGRSVSGALQRRRAADRPCQFPGA